MNLYILYSVVYHTYSTAVHGRSCGLH